MLGLLLFVARERAREPVASEARVLACARFTEPPAMTLLALLSELPKLNEPAAYWANAEQSWSQLMNFVRIALTFLGAIFVLYEVRAIRMRERMNLPVRKTIAVVMTVIAFFAYFDFFNPNVRYRDYIHRHEFFHYYLGSKYSEELGYTRLYECAAAAEIDLGREREVWARELRDLHVNLIRPTTDPEVKQHIQECHDIFAKNPERWEAFKKDVNWVYSQSMGEYWKNMQKDHGYNPPPVWTMTGKLFSSFGNADLGFFQLLSGVDVILQAGAVVLLFWAFGWRVGAIASVFWGCNFPANFYWTGGAFLRQDWFFFITAAVCLARKRRFTWAGAALMWSALLRVFPVLLFGGAALIIVFELYRHYLALSRLPAEAQRGSSTLGELWNLITGRASRSPRSTGALRDMLAFARGATLALLILVPASMLTTGGVTPYKEFAAHTLGTHNRTPLTNHMGLKTLMVHDWSGRMRFLRDDNMDDPFETWKVGRATRADTSKHLRHGISLAIMVWIAWALRRTKSVWIALGLAVPISMCLVELTCYYYSIFICVAVLAAVKREFGAVALLASGISQIIGVQLYYWIDDRFAAESWLFMLLSVLMLFTFSRPFTLARLKAWLDGKRETPPGPAPVAP